MDIHSMERLVPDYIAEDEATGSETLKLHLERYRFAGKTIDHGDVLDMACGVGYGSSLLMKMLGDKINTVTGVDISESAIAYARSRYGHEKINFIVGDALKFDSGKKFDFIISLETIEHLPDPKQFITHLSTLIKPGGQIIASVPTTPTIDANPHHLNDFTAASFRNLFNKNEFTQTDVFRQIQPFSPLNIILKKEKRAENLRSNIFSFYLSHPKSFYRRVISTCVDGFNIHYTTMVCTKK